MASNNPIDCIKKHTPYLLKKEGVGEAITKEEATRIAIDEFESLYTELEDFKASISPEPKKYKKEKYVSPDKSDVVDKIRVEYDDKINEINVKIESKPNGGAVVESDSEVSGVAVNDNKRGAIIEEAVAVAKKIESTSMFAKMLKESAESGDMVDFEDNVKSVAEQANDPDSYNGAVKVFGQDMVDVAQMMFPKEKSEPISIKSENDNSSVDKLIKKLDSLKITQGKLFTLPPGINLLPVIWNGGIEAVKKAIIIGDSISVAIKKGVDRIRQMMAESGEQFTKQQEDEVVGLMYREFVDLSDKNKRNIDKLVDLTVRQDTDQTKVFEYLDKSVSDAGLAQLLKDYYNAQLQSKGKEVDLRNLGFTKNQILSIRGFERAYREGKRTFPELVDAMNEKSLQAETQEEKDTYKKVVDYLYNKYRDEIDFQQSVMSQNSAEGFTEFVNDFKVSITDGALGDLVETFGISEDPTATTRLESQDRIGRNLTDEQKGAIRKEATAFAFEQFRVDVDKAITMFQGKYGEKYINEMLSFVQDENNKDDARLAVSVGLHNHIRYLMSNIGESVLTQGELRDVLSKNIITNQQLSRKASLMLNMLRAWNDDKLDVAAIGAVPPEIRTGSEIIREALVSDITDEDLIRSDAGGFQSLEQSEQEAEDNRPKTSKATKSVKRMAKMSAMSSSNLKKRIEERIKLCK